MANTIPREFIQQVLDRTELVDFIDSRIPLRKKSGNNYFACCPFHNEKSPSFCVSQTKQFYHCFGCGAHGNAIDFLIQYDRLSFPEAIETLAKHAGMEIPHEKNINHKTAQHTSLYELLENASQQYQNQLRQQPIAIDYLKKRGISGEIAKQFCLGFAPNSWDNILKQLGKSDLLKKQLLEAGMLIKKDEGGFYDRFRERIMFPIHDRRGRIVGFGGRILEKGDPKYLNSPETPVFQKSHELYGLYHALKANRQLDRALIVEGYMDVITLFQYEITYAVATLGTATSASHLQRLFRYTKDIIFCFDGDNAGRTAAWRALLVTLPVMNDGVQIRFMFLPEGEDPDSLVRKEGKNLFEQRIQHALTIADFFFQHMAAQADVNSTDGRARFVKLCTEHLNQLPEGIFQQMMFDELAKKARTTVTHLKPQTKTASNRPQLQKARSPSALRLAITLLVQNPELAQHLTTTLPPLQLAGFDLLVELIDTLKNHPILTTGGLLEHWRDHPHAQLIAKFAQIEHMTPEQGLKNEFLGAISQLQKLGRKQLIDAMLNKASQVGLSPEEKQQLQELIHTN